jgi:ABC-type antimicrobial peptide transport system permease subunit
MFPNEDPLGKRLQVNWNTGLDEIVGVVGDVRISGLASDVRSQIYFPLATANVGFVNYVVRARVDERSLGDAVAATIRTLDPNLPVRSVQPMQSLIDASVAAPAVATWLIGAFGVLALLLALVGVAGLQAAWVAARLPEFGIRLALGATPRSLRRLVLGQAGRFIGAGLALGLASAWAASRLIAGLLYDTPPADPATFGVTAGAVALLGLAASAAAARRATTVNPADTLRGS